ncbi:uncharacterized protein LOC133182744 [Saccostrea echinata]|uniref:uncharacterized protein LOC133182744 n=1 Tax=Saccostrea echinata TaxID=191078 RepID=UPI002A7F0EB4|nr:uncharacterized protein LOC133182744 [Saccostrea echinata]
MALMDNVPRGHIMRFLFVICVSLAFCGRNFAQINPQLNAQLRPGQIGGVPGQFGVPGQIGGIPGQLGTQFNQFGMQGQLGMNQFGAFNQFGNQFGINGQFGRNPSLVPSGQLGGFAGTTGFNQFGTTGFNTPLGSPFGNQFGTGFNQFGTGFNNGLNTFNRFGQPGMVGQFPGQFNQFNQLNPGLRQPVEMTPDPP